MTFSGQDYSAFTCDLRLLIVGSGKIPEMVQEVSSKITVIICADSDS